MEKFDPTKSYSLEDINNILARMTLKQEEYEAKSEKRMKKIEENYGGFSKSLGEEAEHYFYKAFKKNKNVFGEHFEIVTANAKSARGWEYDILLVNDTSIGVIEVKHKLKLEHINQFLFKKLPAFKIEFPQYKDYRIYAGVATMIFKEECEKYAIEKGLYAFARENNQIQLLNPNDFIPQIF